jgi:hypothetical protein
VSLGFFEEDILERRENIPYSKKYYTVRTIRGAIKIN